MPDWLVSVLTHPVTLLMVGGGIGTNARYWFGRLMILYHGKLAFPLATMLINIAGSFVLGLVAAAYLRHPDPIHRNWYLLLAVGFCGGFTTFSAFSLETFEMIELGKFWLAALYVFASVAGGLAGVWLAIWMRAPKGVI